MTLSRKILDTSFKVLSIIVERNESFQLSKDNVYVISFPDMWKPNTVSFTISI